MRLFVADFWYVRMSSNGRVIKIKILNNVSCLNKFVNCIVQSTQLSSVLESVAVRHNSRERTLVVPYNYQKTFRLQLSRTMSGCAQQLRCYWHIKSERQFLFRYIPLKLIHLFLLQSTHGAAASHSEEQHYHQLSFAVNKC